MFDVDYRIHLIPPEQELARYARFDGFSPTREKQLLSFQSLERQISFSRQTSHG
ncbi:hypothetical protein [Methanoregula sp.]|uniref:hypothetical protein n=1 Tax=Methanoregula sp. TaxID=2052170 RepID=UPI003BB07871